MGLAMDGMVVLLIGLVGASMMLLFFVVAMVTSVIDQRNKARADLVVSTQTIAEKDADLRLHRTSGAELAAKYPWTRRKLMNGSEFRVYCALEQIIARGPGGHRLFSQVGFGGFLEVPVKSRQDKEGKAAFHAVARKRADFLIIDRRGLPVAVVEFQGHDHYQGNAHDRDQAKRVACHRAGIRFIEVPADGLTEGQRTDLENLLGVSRLPIAAE